MFMAFDNSSPNGKPVLLASRVDGRALDHIRPGVNPAVDQALAGMD
jgi:hypothetical protein